MTASATPSDAADAGNEVIASHCQRENPEHDHQQAHIHAAPSMSDLLATKRQRVKSLQNLPAEASAQAEDANQQAAETDADLRSPQLVGIRQTRNSQEQQDQQQSGPRPADRDLGADGEPGLSSEQELGEHQRAHSLETANAHSHVDLGPGFAEAFVPAVFGESMSAYFQRLRGAMAAAGGSGADGCSGNGPAKVLQMEADGIYVHKRPIRGPNGAASPLAACGSVLHHVVVFVKQGAALHTLDYGPANGADVTANILEEAPAKRVLASGPADAAETAADDADAELPYLYLGPAARGVEHPVVQQMIAFAESRPYHAIRNNCIHFADALVRVMTVGAVRAAPLLYDMYCGVVPPVDNPMLLMMQLMMRLSWFVVVDGSPLAAAFAATCAAEVQQLPAAGPTAAAVAAADEAVASAEEEEENNAADAGAVTPVAATAMATAARARGAAECSAEVTVEAVAASVSVCVATEQEVGAVAGVVAGAAACLRTAEQQAGAAGMGEGERGEGAAARREREERRQEQENDRAAEATATAARAATAAAGTSAADVEMAEADRPADAATAATGAAGAASEAAADLSAGGENAGWDAGGAESQQERPVRLPSLPPRKPQRNVPPS